MKKLEVDRIEETIGGDWACDYTLNALYAFGAGAIVIPGLQIVGGVTLAIGLALRYGNGCGY
ncbi:hypothetical protein CLV98_102480 [Dyadobacter jejuensis]|uniref:Uncharacterized protein n=1 Tax=Dyadobacter jejuensis TaxID=1082580 RepID=A0A316AQF5_9BACT|nr:hypothetical protein [Dyadobacter jejuensis]PWJ59646.1 hypothetical protein CLV98_102480 [Dyadobacter jejuensis]